MADQDSPFVDMRTPVAPLTAATLDAQKAQQLRDADETKRENDATSLGTKIGASSVNSSIGAVDRFITNFKYSPDPNWIGKPVDDEVKKWEKAGLGDYLSLLEKSVSRDHADALYGEAYALKDSKETLGKMSTVGRLGVGLTDPGAAAVGALALPVRGVSLTAGIIRAGLSGAAQNTALSLVNKANDPTMEWHDVLGDAATGFALGGAFHGMFKGLEGSHAEVVDQLNKNSKPDPVQPQPDTFGADTLSSARVPNPDQSTMDVPMPPKSPDAETRLYDAQAEADVKTAFLGARRSLSARMAQSDSPLVRMVGRKLLAERVGYTDKNIAVEEAAEQMSRRLHEKVSAKFNGAMDAAWTSYRKDNGISVFDAGAAKDFREQIGRYMRDPSAEVDPRIAAVAKSVNETTAQVLDEAKMAGVPGAGDVKPEGNWLPRMMSREGFEDLFQQKKLHFDDVRNQLVRESIKRGLRKQLADAGDNGAAFLNDDLTDKVADAWLKRARNKALSVDNDSFHTGLSGEHVDSIEALLHDAGVPPEKAAILTDSMRQQVDDKGVHARFKSRIPMDESYSAEITSRRTGETHTVAMHDLLENDVGHLIDRYARDMAGWTALKSKLGVGTQAELDALRKQVVDEASKSGGKGKDMGRMFDIGVNTTLGRSTELNPGGASSRAGRMIRDYSHLLYMNQMGWSMAAEIGPTMAYAGLRTSLRAMPGVNKLFKRMANGDFAEKEMRLYADMYAPGTDLTRNPVYLRTDALGESMFDKTSRSGKVLNKIDNTQQVLKRAQSVLSGMAPILSRLQVWAARGSMMKLLELANARKVSQSWIDRLRNHGMTAEAQEAIFSKLKGIRSVDKIADEWPKWDVETREAISAYMATVTRRQVTEGLAGDSIEMMHSAAGKPFTQFRRFMTASYEAHMLNAMHMRDWQAFHMVTLSTLFATLGMGARTYVNTIGNPEEREKQMDLKALTFSGIQMSSYSSIIPMLVDTGVHDIAGYDPVFAYGRSSGLDSGVKGIPTLATAERLWNVMGIPGRLAAQDHQLSKQDVSNLWKLMWLNNATGFRNIGDQIANQFPDINQP
jgi:hypothetical protein